MFNNLLGDYKGNDYVYIIEGCLNDYASLEPANNERCPICGEEKWPITEGYVKDIKRAKELNEIGFNSIKKLVLEKWKQNG